MFIYVLKRKVTLKLRKYDKLVLKVLKKKQIWVLVQVSDDGADARRGHAPRHWAWARPDHQ